MIQWKQKQILLIPFLFLHMTNEKGVGTGAGDS